MESEKTIQSGFKIRALVCGHTGAAGMALLDALLASPYCESIVAVGRRESLRHKGAPKLTQHIVPNMLEINSVNPEIAKGINVAFCCIGTPFNDVFKTLFNKQKVQEYQSVDFGIATAFAKFAKSAGAEFIGVITGEKADSKSTMVMTSAKGETEDFIQTLGFQRVAFLRPGLLKRGVNMGWLERMFSLGGLLGLPVADLAKAMLWFALTQTQAVKAHEAKDIDKAIAEFKYAF